MFAETQPTIGDIAGATFARVLSVLVNLPNTTNVCPNAGFHLHSLAPPTRNVEPAEPFGISGRYSDSTQSLSISIHYSDSMQYLSISIHYSDSTQYLSILVLSSSTLLG